MRHWSHAFIGIPYAKADCWELVRRVYSMRYGIELPSYEGERPSAEETEEASRAIRGVASGPPWSRVGTPKEGDVGWLWVVNKKAPSHVGILLAGGTMLHTRRRTGSILEPYRTGFWAPRLVGIFRHERRGAPSVSSGSPTPSPRNAGRDASA